MITSKDGVHLSAGGKQVFGKLIAKALKKYAKGSEKIVCFGDSITHLGYIMEVLKELSPQRFPIYTTSVACNRNKLQKLVKMLYFFFANLTTK